MNFVPLKTKISYMKKETGIIIAGAVGFLAVVGIVGFRKFLKSKKKNYKDDYADFHRLFEKRYGADDHHGVEFLSML